MLLPILVGAMLGGLFALAARSRGGTGEVRLLALGLVVAALIYKGCLAASPGLANELLSGGWPWAGWLTSPGMSGCT